MTSALSVQDLTVYYDSRTLALKDVSIEVPQGDFLGILGPNGGGKSTFLKAIIGLVKPERGTIKAFGKSIGKERGLIGYVPQFSNVEHDFPITVEQVLLTSLVNGFSRISSAQKDKAHEVLGSVGIENLAKRNLQELSGGEFQRLLIARALCRDPRLLLLDEPTASVDPQSRKTIFQLLGDLNRAGMTIMIVSHDTLSVSGSVKHIACFTQTLVYHGEPSLSESLIKELYGGGLLFNA